MKLLGAFTSSLQARWLMAGVLFLATALSVQGVSSHASAGPPATPTPTPTPTSVHNPDLVVLLMSIELETGGACNQSTQLGVRVNIRNQGSADAGPFVMDVNGAQQMVGGGLPRNGFLSLWFPGYQVGKNTAFVDATDLVAEHDETNNQLSQTLPLPTQPPTCTPAPTLAGVGGIARLPGVQSQASPETARGESETSPWLAFAAAGTAAALVLAGAAAVARRRGT